MKKEQKLIKAAYESLGYEYDKDSLKTIKEIENLSKDATNEIENLINIIERCKESIEKLEECVAVFQELLRQIKIEEYKAINPKAKDIFFP